MAKCQHCGGSGWRGADNEQGGEYCFCQIKEPTKKKKRKPRPTTNQGEKGGE